ncbi:hypothetical protein JCM10450v2_008215 [Rhodotorula kratochvilovae]
MTEPQRISSSSSSRPMDIFGVFPDSRVILKHGNTEEFMFLLKDHAEAVQQVRKKLALPPGQIVDFEHFVRDVGWLRITPCAWKTQIKHEVNVNLPMIRVTVVETPSVIPKKRRREDEREADKGLERVEACDRATHSTACQRLSDPPYEIFVKLLGEGPLHGLRVNHFTHVLDIKRQLVLTGRALPPCEQRLLCGGMQLSDERTLGEEGVHKGARLQLTGRLRGRKPVIYLLPPAHLPSATVSLALSPEWDVSALYPVVNVKMDERGRPRVEWTVSAAPDGSLVELSSGLELKYLFWEATTTGRTSSLTPEPSFHPSSPSLDRSNGVLLPFPSFLAHLDAVLARLSLHTAARNDFLTYWMAHFTRIRDKGQQIAFRFVPQAEFARAAQLGVAPRPDVVTRVFLLFKGVDEGAASAGWRNAEEIDWMREVGIKEEKVRDEALFRVLEWGGMEVV